MGNNYALPYPTTCIDRAEQLRECAITFDALRLKYGTFRPRSNGFDRHGRKKYNSRVGIQTDLGDIEESLWLQLVAKLIEDMGETALLNHLRVWIIKNAKWLKTKPAIEKYALELHMARIFDNPLWESFVPFNRKYRPDYLASFDLATVVNTCCNKPYQITMRRLNCIQGKDSCCEHCGRSGPFKVIGGNI